VDNWRPASGLVILTAELVVFMDEPYVFVTGGFPEFLELE